MRSVHGSSPTSEIPKSFRVFYIDVGSKIGLNGMETFLSNIFLIMRQHRASHVILLVCTLISRNADSSNFGASWRASSLYTSRSPVHTTLTYTSTKLANSSPKQNLSPSLQRDRQWFDSHMQVFDAALVQAQGLPSNLPPLKYFLSTFFTLITLISSDGNALFLYGAVRFVPTRFPSAVTQDWSFIFLHAPQIAWMLLLM